MGQNTNDCSILFGFDKISDNTFPGSAVFMVALVVNSITLFSSSLTFPITLHTFLPVLPSKLS